MTGLDIFVFIIMIPIFFLPLGVIVSLILIIISSILFQIKETTKE